ncbi:unnamed protein product [Meganyctiphanes norvegica]|uniref:NADP-dependent oxidoreductase domain-containing protein n=1 Tax=Meganyctiphanes norvegica TaxID=48144 RepID=A0AAV2QGE7_MEGNR
MPPSKIPSVKLSNGESIPVLGIGTWKSEPEKATQILMDAIDAGYRHIDAAKIYRNEPAVGQAICNKIADGTVKREDLFITGKVWNTFHSRDLVVPSVRETLKDLKITYCDLFMIHWPMGFRENAKFGVDGYVDGDDLTPKDKDGKLIPSDVDYIETWKGLEDAVELGLVKSLGICNFNISQIERIFAICKIKPVSMQVECHAYQSQTEMIKYARSKGITVTGYSPLGSGDRVWRKESDPVLMTDPAISAMAIKYGKSNAQILIKFNVQRGVLTIPKPDTMEHIFANMDVFDFELSAEDLAKLEGMSLTTPFRYNIQTWLNHHPHYPWH